ncbi:hypothetical protein [Paenibacillus sp. Soil522]|uniref:hypothetical protein n=1 Tax=Paenibacillus sp. Soil522 TaxID=1736388 RepID=UPI0006FF798E|nr:hypothetical protein [Paenibacillus sp. Soil522]KRE45486.1 hypothetical protein ASG81_12790 [Paenibacillus sp. Soil522]
MHIGDYLGQVVVLELSTMATHEGVLEPVEDSEISDYVRVRNGSEMWLLPVKDIVKVTPVQSKSFTIK